MNQIPELTEMIEILKKQPQTYETLLKENFDNRNTITNLLRHKISIWINFRFIMCGVLVGSRFGKKIFFHNNKEYTIVITRIKSQFNYHYCDDILENEDDTLTLKNCNTLDKHNWINVGNLIINRNELIKWL